MKTSTVFALAVISAMVLNDFQPSSSSAVSLIGGVIRARHTEQETKYPRKDCPVCEGKGWYISGDDIEKVDCGYCEPEKKTEPQEAVYGPVEPEEKTVDNPPLVPVTPKSFILMRP